jgi:hypothetical protein
MPDGKPITDPETIAAYVRIARIVYGIDDDQHGLGEIDNPPTVVESLGGAKVRAWLPVATLSSDDEIELDEQRAVKTTPSGEVVARVWLPVSHAVVRRRRRQDKRAPQTKQSADPAASLLTERKQCWPRRVTGRPTAPCVSGSDPLSRARHGTTASSRKSPQKLERIPKWRQRRK